MSLAFNPDGTLSKGFEMLARQVIKMMGVDPGLVLTQISDIRLALVRHVEQQDQIIAQNAEIISLLKGAPNEIPNRN